jgi:DNA-binding CsgD family transcriptional regulator/tetratricopeptide (TPR) repeat protein
VAEALLTISPIGRRQQLDSMRSWVNDLISGEGHAVMVEGEPGIGKSSLIRVATSQVMAAGGRVFWANCDELSQAFPLLPLLDTLDEHKVLGRHRRSRIADLLRADASPGNRVDLVAAATEQLLAMVDELCSVAPVMLVVDDLQWADPATVQTLSRLARSVGQLPLLLVGVNRPVPFREDLVALRRTLPPESVLALPNLSNSEVTEFVESMVRATPGDRLLSLATGAAGNPLYLTELIDALVRSRALVFADGRVELAGRRVPQSLAAAIADRLEFLSAPVRAVLRSAALLGLDFNVSELAVVSGRRVSELLPIIDEAILAGVILDNGSELSFRHPLIRAALYEGMPTAVRAAWHRDTARALAQDGAAAGRVARQLLPALESHDDGSTPAEEWMIRWLADVGHQLVGHAPKVAIPLLRWAVAGVPAGVPPHDVLACRLADALFRDGDPAGAAEVAAAALDSVSRPDILVDLHWTLTQCRSMDGRTEESLVDLEHALDAPGVGPEQRARLLVLTARATSSLGRVDAAGRVAEQALEAATSANDRWATGWALGIQTIVHGMRGEAAKALPLYDRALSVAEGDPALADLRLILQINQAVALGDLDRYEDAISAAEQVRQLADDAGNVARLAQAQSVLGELLFDVGRWDDALAEVDLVASMSADPVVECSDHGVAATIQLHRGDGAAGRHLADAARYASWLGDRVIGPFTLAKSLDREQADAPQDALAVLMGGLADSAEEMEETADLLADAVRLAVSVGDRSTARSVVDRAETVARASAVPHRQAVAPHCRGLLDRDPATLLLAADHYQAAGRLLPRAQALEAAGAAFAEGGDLTAARTHFTDAFSLYTELGAGWDLARTQAAFRVYGIRRGPHVRHRRSSQGWDSLTPTELKVVGLVARGLSNPQIANHLFLSRRTVQTHVSHILAKLDLRSRTDIAREASRRDTASLAGFDLAEDS